MFFDITGDILLCQCDEDFAYYDLSTAIGFDFKFSKRIMIKYPDGHNITIECDKKELLEPISSYFLARAHRKFLQQCATRYSFVLMFVDADGNSKSTTIKFSSIKMIKTDGQNSITIIGIDDTSTDYLQRSKVDTEMQMKIITEALQRIQNSIDINLEI